MTHRIRCKMICHEISLNQHTKGMSLVRFGAVYASGVTGTEEDENAVFGRLTPYGEFRAGMVTEVANKLELGKAYYVDISPAD